VVSDQPTLAPHPDIARVNDTTGALARIRAGKQARIQARPPVQDVTTLPDGRVIDAAGRVFYTPTPRKEK